MRRRVGDEEDDLGRVLAPARLVDRDGEALVERLRRVATAVGAVPEMIEDGREGFLVPPGDSGSFAAALDRLALNADLRRVMGSRGRERAGRHFRLEETVAALEGLSRSLLSEKGP